WAVVPVETRNCWSRVGAMLGAVADSVRVVLAGTSRGNAPVLSTVACSPEVRTVTVAPATGAPGGSRTWPVTGARSVPVVGVSGAVWFTWLSAQPASEAITTTNGATEFLMDGQALLHGQCRSHRGRQAHCDNQSDRHSSRGFPRARAGRCSIVGK